jgi:hypothetical protein
LETLEDPLQEHAIGPGDRVMDHHQAVVDHVGDHYTRHSQGDAQVGCQFSHRYRVIAAQRDRPPLQGECRRGRRPGRGDGDERFDG